MRRLELGIHLLEPLVLSERAATGGGHRSLRHVPGTALLGVAAARLYPRLSADDAFTLFHSGRVRFLPGLPALDGQQPGWPVPLCLMRPKTGDKTIAFNDCRDGAVPQGVQVQPLREGFIDAQGRLHQPEMLSVTKTAIEPTTGRVANAQLFSYEALAPGQRLRAAVEADADLPEPLWQALREALCGQRQLGRSRSAEFGRVRIEPIEASAEPGHSVPAGQPYPLWLLSDLAVLDACGQPTAHPSAEDLGLPGRIDWARSFTRARRYAPWNAYRGGFDAERLVLQAGSVLWIVGSDQPVTAGQRSLGRHVEGGLGRVWIDPPLLREPSLTLSEAGAAATAVAPAKTPPSPLLDWFLGRAKASQHAQAADQPAAELLRALEKLYQAARSESGLPDSVPVGPSTAQWRDVANCADGRPDDDTLMHALFDSGTGIARADRPGWKDPLWSEADGRPISFSQAFKSLLQKTARESLTVAEVLALAARRIARSEAVGTRSAHRQAPANHSKEAGQ